MEKARDMVDSNIDFAVEEKKDYVAYEREVLAGGPPRTTLKELASMDKWVLVDAVAHMARPGVNRKDVWDSCESAFFGPQFDGEELPNSCILVDSTGFIEWARRFPSLFDIPLQLTKRERKAKDDERVVSVPDAIKTLQKYVKHVFNLTDPQARRRIQIAYSEGVLGIRRKRNHVFVSHYDLLHSFCPEQIANPPRIRNNITP
jgi:hypothetical protein